MIPTVEDILLGLAAGKITHAQAMAWMEQHFKLAAEEAAPHNWHCYLDGKHGSKEVWKCACGDEVYGDPHKCEGPR